MTWMEFAKKIIPDEPEEVLDIVLWNHTPWPCTNDVKALSRELRRWKRLASKGLSDCCICGKAFRHRSGKVILGAECGDAHI